MDAGRGLGLVGGLGVGATVHYYEQLVLAHERRERRLNLAMVHAETAEVFRFVEAEDRLGLAEYLAGFIARLEAAGAEFAAIPAATPHCCIRELKAISPLPVFDLFEPVNAEVKRRGIRRASVFGTRYVMNAGLFGLVEGVKLVALRPDETERVNRIYMELVATRRGSDEQREGLTALAWRVSERERLDAIILAGTDLALLFGDRDPEFSNIDCAALHLRAIVSGLLD